MKKCPYCAEMIQDEAIKCRYCHSDLTVAPSSAGTSTDAGVSETASGTTAAAATATGPFSSAPAASPTPTDPRPTAPTPDDASQTTAASAEVVTTPAPTDAGAGVDAGATTPDTATAPEAQPVQTSSVRYTHSGYRYVLGYGADFFGIWDRQSPSVATERFPRTDEGWKQAWLRFSALEPNHTAVPADGSAATPGGMAATTTMTPQPTQAAPIDPNDVTAVQYTHSGTRYLLGYGRTFFGIWDRQAPDRPVQRYSRDDAGWAAAWSSYTQMETNFSEVKLG